VAKNAPEEVPPELTDEDIDRQIAVARKKLGKETVVDSANKRKAVEKHLKKKRNLRILRKTDRSHLYTFRCKTDPVERMKAEAKRTGVSIAACMEEAIEEWLKAHEGTENKGDAS
jgi:hypothetical protein